MKLSKLQSAVSVSVFCFLYSFIAAPPTLYYVVRLFIATWVTVHIAIICIFIMEKLFSYFANSSFILSEINFFFLVRALLWSFLSIVISWSLLELLYHRFDMVFNRSSYLVSGIFDVNYFVKDLVSIVFCFSCYFLVNRLVSIKELKISSLKATISELTLQMNPHFLFNSLNSLAYEITNSPKKAEKMTIDLSKYYRLVLKATKKEIHTLDSELLLVKSYLELEKIRTANHFDYKISLAPGVNPKEVNIPVLLIQPLVENSIKYGIVDYDSSGYVEISCYQEGLFFVIMVRDSGRKLKNKQKPGSKTALSNCTERLRLLYGASGTFTLKLSEDKDTLALFKIPYDKVLKL